MKTELSILQEERPGLPAVDRCTSSFWDEILGMVVETETIRHLDRHKRMQI
ncbi:hypothetical protein [Chryseobacterium sp. EZn1]|uniref:hypothetical protein n=1 Tax=Chryseobacterium cupriresistens TaxID=3366770 RepID=UPI003984D7AB